jgi:peptidoglycan/LPS O-acetylase OafA/YrhL
MKQEQQVLFQDRPVAPVHHVAYRRDIDGLRAIAVLSVVLFHAFPAVLRGGFTGVDVFFVISGFLISGILLRELGQGQFSFARFYARRIKRIFPALVLVMAACLAFGWLALFPDEYRQLGRHTMGGAGFAANFFYWAQVGYFDTAAETKPLLHLWSLGIEEQFYIVWPVVLLLVWKVRPRLSFVLAAAALLALASFVLNVATIADHATAVFYNPASRAWELLLGAGLACLQARPAGEQRLPRLPFTLPPDLLSWTGLALLAAGLALVTRERQFPGWWALLPALGAVLLIGAGPQAWFNRVVLSNRAMVWIGLISYPLYLWHWPLLSFAQIVESSEPAPGIRAGAVLLAILLAWLTWRVVERPLRGSARAGRAKVAALCALLAACAAAGAWIYWHDGLPARKPVQDSLANQKALVVVQDEARSDACKKRYGFETVYQFCVQDDVARDPTVVLVGDSHAYHLLFGLTKYYGGIGDNLLMLGTRLPFLGLDPARDPYQEATGPMLELALGLPTVKTVVISALTHLDTTPERRVLVDAVRETFRRFEAAGKRVIFMSDVPLLDFDPRSCLKRAGVASSATRVSCAITRAQWEQQIVQHREVLRGFAREFPQLLIYDPTDALCDDKACHVMIDGRLMYRDNNHLSYDGDLYVGRHFAEWMKKHAQQ